MVYKNKNDLKTKSLNLFSQPQNNSITNQRVGNISNGSIDMNNGIKVGSVSGGSVLISSNNKLVSNKELLNPKIKSKNRDTLVRTIF